MSIRQLRCLVALFHDDREIIAPCRLCYIVRSIMPVLKSYTIWNNKGGVGKSTLAFHTICALAAAKPDVNFLVIDADPQASITTSFLGGDPKLAVPKLVGLSNTFVRDWQGKKGKVHFEKTLSGLLREASLRLFRDDKPAIQVKQGPYAPMRSPRAHSKSPIPQLWRAVSRPRERTRTRTSLPMSTFLLDMRQSSLWR